MNKTKNNKYQSISTSMNIRKYPLISAISLVIFFGMVQGSKAADYYVSPTGSATWASSTNINTPCSASTAMTNAAAGDVVYFRGGTYSLTGPHIPYHGILEPLHSGTAGNPITFAAYPGEIPIMNCNISSGHGCTAMGTGHQNYITIDGFTVQTNNGVLGGAIMMGGQTDTPSTNVTIKNCIINGGSTLISVQDNCEAIRIEGVTNGLIQNNKIYNMRSTNGYRGISGIKSYSSNRITIENNEIYNCETAIYTKSSNDGWIMRYNYLHDNAIGWYATPYYTAAAHNQDNHKFYHNVISKSTDIALFIWAGMDGSHANNNEIYNNTIYSTGKVGGVGLQTDGTDVRYYNNIIQGSPNGQFAVGHANLYTLVECDYNQYGSSPLSFYTHAYGGDQFYTSLESWQASTEVSGGGHPDIHGLASDPLFTNGSGNYSLLSDFNLQSTSPCKGTGRNGVDMGADISLVGLNTVTPSCGDGSCNGTETCSSCSSDCGTCIDITPPSISNGSPSGALPSGTTQTTMSVSTDKNATCRYSSTAGIEYSSMTNTFSTTGGVSHSTTITGLSNGQTYNHYVRCQDTAGNPNTSDYIITFSIASSQGSTITLYPTQDTYIDLNTSINVSGTNLNTYTWPVNQIANAVLMKFNLSSIPANANIQDAKLYLYLTAVDTNTSYPTYANALHRIINKNPNLSLANGYTYDGTNPWTASSCCYNNTPLAQADISSAYDTQQINKTLGFKSWNAAQLIKDWLSNPSANYGLLINSDSAKPADTYRTFASSEYTTTSYRPYLDITYTLSSDTTPPAAPTGLVVN